MENLNKKDSILNATGKYEIQILFYLYQQLMFFSWILIRIFWLGSGFLDPDSEKKSDPDPEQNKFKTLFFD